MRRLACLLAFVFAVALTAPVHAHVATHRQPIHVLFIGNSYTHFHALPLVVRRLLESVDPSRPVRVDAVTHPGWDLGRHWTRGEARRRLEAGHYTHVVLQGHSLDAIRAPDTMAQAVAQFREASGTARVVLYETWARAEGAAVYSEADVGDPTAMQARIDTTYRALAARIGATVAPVGPAFMRVETALPDLRLIQSDRSHPTELGTYVAACVIAHALTSTAVDLFDYRPRRLSRAQASALRAAVGPMPR